MAVCPGGEDGVVAAVVDHEVAVGLHRQPGRRAARTAVGVARPTARTGGSDACLDRPCSTRRSCCRPGKPVRRRARSAVATVPGSIGVQAAGLRPAGQAAGVGSGAVTGAGSGAAPVPARRGFGVRATIRGELGRPGHTTEWSSPGGPGCVAADGSAANQLLRSANTEADDS
jgi:hypothetical protein